VFVGGKQGLLGHNNPPERGDHKRYRKYLKRAWAKTTVQRRRIGYTRKLNIFEGGGEKVPNELKGKKKTLV